MALLGLLAVVACGSRASPLAPLRIVPATITPLAATRIAERVYLEFTVPEQDSNGATPGDIVRVEVYAVTTQPVLGEDPAPVDDDWLDAATLVGELFVAPPGAAPPPAAGAGDMTGGAPIVVQGEDATVVERLTPEALEPVVIGEPEEDEEPAEDAEAAPAPPGPLASPPIPPAPVRSYVAFGISSRGRMSDPSPVAMVPLVAPPGPPPGLPAVTYTEEAIEVRWRAPRTFRRPVQAEAEPPTLESSTGIGGAPPSDYVLYDHTEAALGRALPEPLGPPGREQSFTHSDVTFGDTRCYAVRVVDYVETTPIQGPASLAACVELRDTFPPATPAGLIAVADDSGISLVWDPNDEADLAGYVVLRGSASDATLQRLTAEPLTATAYQDTEVIAGERYVYRLAALDTAVPPNVSAPSEPVTETAR